MANTPVQVVENHGQFNSSPATITATINGFTKGNMLLVFVACTSDSQEIFDLGWPDFVVSDSQSNDYFVDNGSVFVPSASGMAAYVDQLTAPQPNVTMGTWGVLPKAAGSITVTVEIEPLSPYHIQAANILLIEVDGILPNPNPGFPRGALWCFPTTAMIPGSGFPVTPAAEAINIAGFPSSGATTLTCSIGSLTPGIASFLYSTEHPPGEINGPFLLLCLVMDVTTCPVSWTASSGFSVWAQSQNTDPTNPLSFAVLAGNVADASGQPFSCTAGGFTSGDTILMQLGALGPNLESQCGSPPAATIGVPYSYFLPRAQGVPATGDPTQQTYGFRLEVPNSLPPGLALNETTGEVSGTPLGPAGNHGVSFFVFDAQSFGHSIPTRDTIDIGCQFTILAPPGANMYGTFVGQFAAGHIGGGTA